MNPIGQMSRRDMLHRCGLGFGMLGLAGTLQGGVDVAQLAPKKSHFKAKAKQVVHLFMNGGPSHVDTFDPKPLLAELHGKPLPTQNLRTERKTGAAMKSPYKFSKYGHSGIEVSELFAKTAEHVDEMCIIRSMYADVPNHEQSLMLMNCGEARQPRPSFGSWLTYGLGSENQDLPGFIVMCPGGYPIVSTKNWQSAFLPGAYQGTYLDTKHTEVEKLIANIRNQQMSLDEQRRQLDFVQQLNQRHLQPRGGDPQLEARIESLELAFRMQTEAAEAFDIRRESSAVLKLYGEGTHARQLLITRRLIERGVRFVQVWSGAGQPWDNHNDLEATHRKLAGEWDQPIAAFLTDLKQRGLLDSTLVLWGGEFGRTPVSESGNGRDHNPFGFTCWLAGGGVKPGFRYGSTDEIGLWATDGFRSEERRVGKEW